MYAVDHDRDADADYGVQGAVDHVDIRIDVFHMEHGNAQKDNSGKKGELGNFKQNGRINNKTCEHAQQYELHGICLPCAAHREQIHK